MTNKTNRRTGEPVYRRSDTPSPRFSVSGSAIEFVILLLLLGTGIWLGLALVLGFLGDD